MKPKRERQRQRQRDRKNKGGGGCGREEKERGITQNHRQINVSHLYVHASEIQTFLD